MFFNELPMLIIQEITVVTNLWAVAFAKITFYPNLWCNWGHMEDSLCINDQHSGFLFLPLFLRTFYNDPIRRLDHDRHHFYQLNFKQICQS